MTCDTLHSIISATAGWIIPHVGLESILKQLLVSENTMPLHAKLSIVAVFIALALVAAFTLAWPARDVALGGLSFALSGKVLLGLLGMGLACAGADAIVRSNPRIRPERLRRPLLRCILPTAVTAAAWMLLVRVATLEHRVIGVAASAAAAVVLIAVEYYAADSAAPGRRVVTAFLPFAIYSVAALLYGGVHTAVLGANVARAGTMVGAVLAVRLLGEDELPLGRILCVGAGIGLLLGASSRLLHARLTNPVAYSLTLVVFLYVLAGLARQFLWGKLRREVVLEYSLIGLAALVLLFFYTR